MQWRIQRAVAVGLGVAYAAFMLIQPGSKDDEGEHLHVAWLIAKRGLVPTRDFFEHHTPLLWHVLGLAYRAGVDGPEVLYLARVFTLVCAGLWIWMLLALARRWGAKQPQAGLFAACAFVLIAVFAGALIVTRPETLAMALLALALLAWTRRVPSLPFDAAAGALVALSVCTTPRFALLAPVLLLTAPPQPRRIAAAAAGGVAALALFFGAICPWSQFIFDVRFSALLQGVGNSRLVDTQYLGPCILVAAFVCGALWSSARPQPRALLTWLAHGAVIALACTVSAGRYPYAPAFAPLLLWSTLFAAWLEAQPEAEGALALRGRLVGVALVASLAITGASVSIASSQMYAVPALTTSRRMVLDSIPEHSRVFLMPAHHPVTVEDASWWSPGLNYDAPSKTCDAADEYRKRYPDAAVQLPPCDFTGDLLRNRPAVVSRLIELAAPAEQMERFKAALYQRYGPADALDNAPAPPFAGNVWYLRSTSPGARR